MYRQLLNISSVPLRLNLNVPIGQYNMSSPKASWEVGVTKSEMKTKTDPVKFKTDRREMYASMGVYMPDNFRRKTESEAKNTVMETIAEIGDDWRSIGETQGATLIDICIKNASRAVELYQAWIPSVRPNLKWEGGTPTKIDFSKFKLDINWKTNIRPNIEYIMGKRDISVSQWYKVNVNYIGTTSDIIKIGSESAGKLNIKI